MQLIGILRLEETIIKRYDIKLAYSEVVEGGVRQATSCNVFGQLVQHLWVLGLDHQ